MLRTILPHRYKHSGVQLNGLRTQPEYKEIVFVLPNGKKVLAKIRLTTIMVNECDQNVHVVMNDVHKD